MKRVVIFDFDGTIADTFPLILAIFHKVQKRAVPLNKEQEILMRGAALMQGKLRTVLKAASHLGISYWRLPFIFAITQVLLRKRMNEVQPFKGMPELLRKLADENVELFIVSANSSGNIRRFLKAYDLQHSFVKVYGNVRPRNKAKTIKHIAKWRRVEAASIKYVGDENRDIAAGHVAAVTPIAVSWGYNDVSQLQAEHPADLVNDSTALGRVLGT